MQLDAMGPLSPSELAALEAAQAETLDFIAHADIGRKPARRDATLRSATLLACCHRTD